MAGQLKHIEMAIQQLNRFRPENESVGQFLDESAKVLQASKVTDEGFLMTILAGCIEYKPLLDVVVNAFYIRDGKHCLLSEHNLYVGERRTPKNTETQKGSNEGTIKVNQV